MGATDNQDPGTPGAGTSLLEDVEEATRTATPWQTVLWNDSINLVGHVTRSLMEILEIDQAKAEHYMMTAHTEGKAAVFSGDREKCEGIMGGLQDRGLWATVEKSGA